MSFKHNPNDSNDRFNENHLLDECSSVCKNRDCIIFVKSDNPEQVTCNQDDKILFSIENNKQLPTHFSKFEVPNRLLRAPSSPNYNHEYDRSRRIVKRTFSQQIDKSKINVSENVDRYIEFEGNKLSFNVSYRDVSNDDTNSYLDASNKCASHLSLNEPRLPHQLPSQLLRCTSEITDTEINKTQQIDESVMTPLLNNEQSPYRQFDDDDYSVYQSALSYSIDNEIGMNSTLLSTNESTIIEDIHDKVHSANKFLCKLSIMDKNDGYRVSSLSDIKRKVNKMRNRLSEDETEHNRLSCLKKSDGTQCRRSWMSLFKFFPSHTVSDVNRRCYAATHQTHHSSLNSNCIRNHYDEYLTLPIAEGYIYVKCNELKPYHSVIFTENGKDRFYNLKEIVQKISNGNYFDEAEACIVNHWLKLITEERQRRESNSLSTNLVLGMFVLVGSILCTLLITLTLHVLPAISDIVKKK